MQKKQKTTIQDIADIVGVSKTTVSRYLNKKYKYMSADTRAQIEDAIQQTNFRPNRLANSLKTSKSGLIGLVISDMTAALVPYIIGSVCNSCTNYGKKAIVINSNGNPQNEIILVKELLDQQVEGIIVASGQNHDFYYTLSREECPVVLMSRINNPQNPDKKMDAIYINHWESTRTVITHLAQKGFEKIVLFSTPYRDTFSALAIRELAAIQTCRDLFGSDAHCSKVVLDHPWLPTASRLSSRPLERSALHNIIKDCYLQSKNERTALFVIATALMGDMVCCCYQMGIQLCDRFTLAGYDSYQFSRFTQSEISVIEQPLIEMGEVATERLMQQIEARGSLPPIQTALECRLLLH